MLHLKDKINNSIVTCEINSVSSIADILSLLKGSDSFVKRLVKDENYDELIKNKYVFSDGCISDEFILKLIEDSDIDEYIIESSEFIGTFIDSEDLKIDKNNDYLFLYDDDISIMIPAVKVKDNEEEYYKIYIEKLIYVREFLLDKCDGCSCTSLKELLFNLYPEINTGLHEKYADFKGCVCSECLTKMEQGLSLKNEQSESSVAEGDVSEKIDEFSSIEEILKFCGMDNRDELEQALKNKIQ
ncbi:MAG: hypothetical protein ACI32Y_07790 [Clostridium sp.]